MGGSVEKGETINAGLIREAKEELNIDISNAQLENLGKFVNLRDGRFITRHVFIISVDDTWHFEVQEGNGAKWVKLEEMIELMKEFSSETGVRIAKTTLEYLSKE